MAASITAFSACTGITLQSKTSVPQEQNLSKSTQDSFQVTNTVENTPQLDIKRFNVTVEEGGPKPTADQSKWGPDTTPHLNMVTNEALRKKFMGNSPFPHGREKSSDFSTKTCCGTGKLHWGARIPTISSPVNNKWGVSAYHKINLTQTFPAADTLVYSPTTMPPNNAPVEAVTVYYRPAGSSGTGRVFGVWDHTGIHANNWIIYKDMTDVTWQNKYTANYVDGQYYSFQIMKTSSTSAQWTVQLYNYQTNIWEHQGSFPLTFTTSTPPAQSTGWGFHEPKFDDICPSLLPIKLVGLQVFNGSTWYDNSSANGSGLINGGSVCSNWNRNMAASHYHWTINF